MTMRLLFAATVATGLVFAPASFAQDTAKPAASKSKVAKTPKKTRRASPSSVKAKKSDDMMGNPYSTQKDEMTR